MERKVEEERRGLLRLGELVPDFEAITTHGKIKLSDFKGKWVILFFTQQILHQFALQSLLPLQKYTKSL